MYECEKGMTSLGKLSAAKVKSLLAVPGRYNDGDGLILFVRKPGQASWVARLQHNGKRRDYGLGSAKLYTLAEARERAWDVRRALADGRDPKMLWRPPEQLQKTFRDAAEEFLAQKGLSERRTKQAKSQLSRFAYPHIGKLQLQSIDADLIAECLRPIWTSKPETARQLRSLIERILRFARPDGALFAGTLGPAVTDRLPKQPPKGNFKALPYQELPAFVSRLRTKDGAAALALQFAILTACRSGEVRSATWAEFDLQKQVWTIPASRMKASKPHRVPLCNETMRILSLAAERNVRGSEFVFPNTKGAALSDMALTKTLRDMGMSCTAHGFRSTFRDWVAEQTSVAGEIAEAALAHSVPNAVEAAYKRTDFFDHRRNLMECWSRFALGIERNDICELGGKSSSLRSA